MLDKIKLLLNIADDAADDLLNTLIAICKEEAYIYCNLPEYNEKLDSMVVFMVIEKYNRIGSEGTTSQSVSGISATYESFYSEKIVKMLNKHRRVRCV